MHTRHGCAPLIFFDVVVPRSRKFHSFIYYTHHRCGITTSQLILLGTMSSLFCFFGEKFLSSEPLEDAETPETANALLAGLSVASPVVDSPNGPATADSASSIAPEFSNSESLEPGCGDVVEVGVRCAKHVNNTVPVQSGFYQYSYNKGTNSPSVCWAGFSYPYSVL